MLLLMMLLTTLSLVLLLAVIYLFSKYSDLGVDLRGVRWEMAKLAARLASLESPKPPPATQQQQAEVIRAPVAEATPVPVVQDKGPEIVLPLPVEQPAPPLPPPPPPPPRSRTREEWEALIGGKLLNRIGALALIIGVGFFLKYAFDQNWITEWMRVAIGGLAGIMTLLLAGRSHRKGFAIFAQGLVGAGIAILYLSVYASFNFYSLVSQPVAFILMSCVTAVAFAQAFRYDSVAVSLLGWVGGFLTPFLLNTGEANPAGLFTYLALLDVAVLAVLVAKDRWIVLLPLTMVGTYLLYYLWYVSAYQSGDVWTAVCFLSIFWALFHLLDSVWCMREKKAYASARRWGSLANTVVYYTGVYLVMDADQHQWLAAVTLAIGVVCILSAMMIQRRTTSEQASILQNAITGIVFVLAATQIHFSRFTVVMVYALEAALLAWIGRQWNLRYVLYAACGVLLLGIVVLVSTPGALVAEDVAQFTALFSLRGAAFLSLIAGVICVLWMVHASRMPVAVNLPGALHVEWIFLVFLFLTVECIDYYRSLEVTIGDRLSDVVALEFRRTMMLATVWTVLSVPLVIVGKRKTVAAVMISGLVIAGLAWLLAATRGVEFSPIEEFRVVVNLRAGVLLLVSAALLLFAYTMRAGTRGSQYLSPFLHYAWIVLVFILCTAETVDFFRHRAWNQTGSVVEELTFAKFMVLGGVWAILAVVLGWTSLKTHVTPMMSAGIWGAILAALIAGVRGIAFDPVQAYTPILNVRLVMILVTLGALNWFLHQSRKASAGIEWRSEFQSAMRIIVVALTLVLITGEIRDFFEQRIANGGNDETIRQMENLKQLFLSSSWLMYSILLMVYGIWRRTRLLRMIAIALFGVAILKIFIYDLSFLDTLYRIFSFLALGVILLAVSYLYQRYREAIFGSETAVNQ